MGLLPLLVILSTAAVSSTLGFNINMNVHHTYYHHGLSDSFFGYELRQFQTASEKGVVVGAPLLANGTGGVFICGDRAYCTPLPLPTPKATHKGSTKGIGTIVAAKTKPNLQFMACSPPLSDGSQYLNSICHQWNSSGAMSNIAAFPGIPSQHVDLVFLLDGSKSMRENDFNEGKNFIKGIMKNLQNTSIQFAAVQFSTISSVIFTFKDFEENKAEEKLDNEKHMSSLTCTHGALAFALENLFDDPASGRLPDATKVVVIITDGSPTDDADMLWKGTYTNIIEQYETLNITRFVIAVGRVDMRGVKTFASEHTYETIFPLHGFSNLKDCLSNLQTAIFNVVDSEHNCGQSLKKELLQSRKGAEIIESKMVFGQVGSLLLTQDKNSQALKTDSLESLVKSDSYMGYSLAAGRRNGMSLYFTSGYDCVDHVSLYHKKTSHFTFVQRVDGEQAGSYFGAVLCPVDIDSDGNTDFLMVGSPLYKSQDGEGSVSVFRLTDLGALVKLRTFSESPRGRFGSSISSLRDLDGDGYMDLAVGAPHEDEDKGAVYIYLGHEEHGVRPKYSQCIRAKHLHVPLKQFGVSIDGKSDVAGLTEIAIGSRGKVVILRSRPVLSVSVHLSVRRLEFSIQQCESPESEPYFPVFTLTTCFKMTERTKSTRDAVSEGLMLSFNVVIDAVRPTSRGSLREDTPVRDARSPLRLRHAETCKNTIIFMPVCVVDMVTPFQVNVSFSQMEDTWQLDGVLDMESKTEATLVVPFDKNV